MWLEEPILRAFIEGRRGNSWRLRGQSRVNAIDLLRGNLNWCIAFIPRRILDALHATRPHMVKHLAMSRQGCQHLAGQFGGLLEIAFRHAHIVHTS